MYTNDKETISDIGGYVDGILSHNRSISHLADDSVMRVAGKENIVLRHARGLAPTDFSNPYHGGEHDVVALGGHSKAAFALGAGERLILSQHIGEMDGQRAIEVFRHELSSYRSLYALNSDVDITCIDAHPGYGSSVLATEFGGSIEPAFHHQAHLESLLIETGPVEHALAFIADGNGMGNDHSLWGGEFFFVRGEMRQRVGSLLPFRLPGGERAAREPRRSALGMLFAAYNDHAISDDFAVREFDASELQLLNSALKRPFNAPLTSSLGRLFDGFAALLGVCTIAEFEAQAPMAMEVLARGCLEVTPFPITWETDHSGIERWDWRNLIGIAREMRHDHAHRQKFAASFHATIVQAIREFAEKLGARTILLSGGVFQNALLVEMAMVRLSSAGFTTFIHQEVPPGDGGLALGQLATAQRRTSTKCV